MSSSQCLFQFPGQCRLSGSPPESRTPSRKWRTLHLAFLGALLLLLAGCQTARPPSPTPPPAVTPVPPRRSIAPGAWRAEADRWLGVKYRRGGTDRSGVDCSGLTSRMYLTVAGVALPRTSQDQSRCGALVSRNNLRPGDLIFFVSLSQGAVDHVALYLGNTQFVHASPSKGVVISSLAQEYYTRRFHSARRIVP